MSRPVAAPAPDNKSLSVSFSSEKEELLVFEKKNHVLSRFRLGGMCIPLCLPACHLVDQRDFNPHAGMKPPPHVAATKPGPQPPSLVTIRFAQPDPPYGQAVTEAVKAALARKPGARFTVLTRAPAGADATATADAAADAAALGRGVAQTIVAAGALPAQVEQLLTTDSWGYRYRDARAGKVKKESSFSEEKEAKRLLFLAAHPGSREMRFGWVDRFCLPWRRFRPSVIVRVMILMGLTA